MTDSSYPHFDAYKRIVRNLRTEWLRVPTLSGKPKKGPRFYAITRCTEEPGDQLGIVSSGNPKGKRWACKTCAGFVEPVWSDGPLPDIEDIREEYHDWVAAKPDLRKIRTF